MTLLEYVKTHHTPDTFSLTSASDNYPHDSKKIETYVRKQKGRALGMTRHDHAAHSEHHQTHQHEPAHVHTHPVPPAASRHAEVADRPPRALLDAKQFPMHMEPLKSDVDVAHNELDDVPDDFRV